MAPAPASPRRSRVLPAPDLPGQCRWRRREPDRRDRQRRRRHRRDRRHGRHGPSWRRRWRSLDRRSRRVHGRDRRRRRWRRWRAQRAAGGRRRWRRHQPGSARASSRSVSNGISRRRQPAITATGGTGGQAAAGGAGGTNSGQRGAQRRGRRRHRHRNRRQRRPRRELRQRRRRRRRLHRRRRRRLDGQPDRHRRRRRRRIELGQRHVAGRRRSPRRPRSPGSAGTASPIAAGVGATGSVAIDWLPCLYTLSVAKSVSAATVNAGGSVIWTVAVTNTGPDPMTRGDTVDLADTLPAGPNGAPAPAFKVLSIGDVGRHRTRTWRAARSRAPASRSARRCRPRARLLTGLQRTERPAGAVGRHARPRRRRDPDDHLRADHRQHGAVRDDHEHGDRRRTGPPRRARPTSSAWPPPGPASASLTINCYDLAITKVGQPEARRRARAARSPGRSRSPTSDRARWRARPRPTRTRWSSRDTFPIDVASGTGRLVSSVGPAGACTRSGSTITCPSGLPAGGVQVLTFTQTVNAATPTARSSRTRRRSPIRRPATPTTRAPTRRPSRIPGLTLDKTAVPSTYIVRRDRHQLQLPRDATPARSPWPARSPSRTTR